MDDCRANHSSSRQSVVSWQHIRVFSCFVLYEVFAFVCTKRLRSALVFNTRFESGHVFTLFWRLIVGFSGFAFLVNVQKLSANRICVACMAVLTCLLVCISALTIFSSATVYVPSHVVSLIFEIYHVWRYLTRTSAIILIYDCMPLGYKMPSIALWTELGATFVHASNFFATCEVFNQIVLFKLELISSLIGLSLLFIAARKSASLISVLKNEESTNPNSCFEELDLSILQCLRLLRDHPVIPLFFLLALFSSMEIPLKRRDNTSVYGRIVIVLSRYIVCVYLIIRTMRLERNAAQKHLQLRKLACEKAFSLCANFISVICVTFPIVSFNGVYTFGPFFDLFIYYFMMEAMLVFWQFFFALVANSVPRKLRIVVLYFVYYISYLTFAEYCVICKKFNIDIGGEIAPVPVIIVSIFNTLISRLGTWMRWKHIVGLALKI